MHRRCNFVYNFKLANREYEQSIKDKIIEFSTPKKLGKSKMNAYQLSNLIMILCDSFNENPTQFYLAQLHEQTNSVYARNQLEQYISSYEQFLSEIKQEQPLRDWNELSDRNTIKIFEILRNCIQCIPPLISQSEFQSCFKDLEKKFSEFDYAAQSLVEKSKSLCAGVLSKCFEQFSQDQYINSLKISGTLVKEIQVQIMDSLSVYQAYASGTQKYKIGFDTLPKLLFDIFDTVFIKMHQE